MDFIKKLEITPVLVAKIAGVGVAGLFGLVIVYYVLGSTLGPIVNQGRAMMAPSTVSGAYGGAVAYDNGDVYSYETKEMAMGMPAFSARNATTARPPVTPQTTGTTAEQFEVTHYNASIETRHLDETCGKVAALKSREDVIFENANTYERGCGYTFKVAHANADEILAFIRKLDPRELSENTYTIKSQIDDYTSQVEILEKKRASIDATLASALRAYDGITALATRTENADALAKIIDSRIGIIERLTQERITITTQLDQLARGKAEQLDRLGYTYFNVSITEYRFIDGKQLGDSWKAALQDFVRKVNEFAQSLSLSLVLLVLFIVQWLLYGVIILLVAKYAWKWGKKLWNA